ncbi:MAG: preprotein translocase subunit SecY [Chlamydiota bacterium]
MESIKNIFSIPDLRKKVFFTLVLLALCRIGTFVPVPGIHGERAMQVFQQATGGAQNFFQLIDMFSGGAFAQLTILALGIMPYISTSIVLQMLVAAVPSLQREVQESSDHGRRKIGRWTRTATFFLSLFQSGILARYALHMDYSFPGIIVPQMLRPTLFGLPWLFFLTFMLTVSGGTLLLMWIGEQITEKGIGNGTSLIIALGILSSFPRTLGAVLQQLNLEGQGASNLSLFSLVVLCALFVITTVGTILIIQGQRRIPLQHARRIVGRREVQGSTSYIPLKINYAGVIPVILTSTFLISIATISRFLGDGPFFSFIAVALSPGNWTYMIITALLIMLFTYFWTSTQFKPDQIASDMKKNGAFIPGVRQGKPTQEFLEYTMNRITFAGALFLAGIAILPSLVGKVLAIDPSVYRFFGGTSLLILVGVILDTTKQIESHLLMKRYDGFMKRKKARKRSVS